MPDITLNNLLSSANGLSITLAELSHYLADEMIHQKSRQILHFNMYEQSFYSTACCTV